jgi:two-component system sensor histidine kinase HydH
MQPRALPTVPRPAMAAIIAIMVVTLAVFTWMVPPHAVVLHNILHHLNILPFMLAGLIFGWKGAARAILLACVLQAPSIYRHWHSASLDAQDQIVELSTFGIAGLIAGVVADRERMQRHHVEETKQELEHVHTELRQNIEHLRKNERLSAAGRLSASLAHEIRNPLASISGAAGILARGNATQASKEECLDILTKESQRLNKLLTNFLDFARPRLPRFQLADPLAVVHSTMLLAQHAATSLGVTLKMDTPPATSEVTCDPEQIKQVLLNLILNAVQASKRGSVVHMVVTPTQELLTIDVADEGCGISASDLESIFDPFFTTKENGTGLGLAVAANIVAQHGGRLSGIPNADRGMTFRLLLPWQQKDISHTAHRHQTMVTL